MGIAGTPTSKVQIIIGILQFCISWSFIAYIWVLGWAALMFLGGSKPAPATAPQAQAQGAYASQGPVVTGAYNMGAIGVPVNPFESKGAQ